MTSNPAALMKVLITYAICVPVAIFLGYLMTDVGNNPTYVNLFFVGALLALILSPLFIKYHYPVMVFGLSCPVTLFFLKGSPPLWEVVVLMSLAIAIIERTINSKKRFISTPSITWPLIFTAAMAYITAHLTGGIGLHTVSGNGGGGKKYITLFLGIATFFALVSRKIPVERRKFYIGLFILSGLPAFIGDIGPLLPSPFNLVNLVIPPTSAGANGQLELGVTRLGALATSAGVVASYFLIKYGIGGIFSGGNAVWRVPVFFFMLGCSMLGGFRNVVFGFAVLCFFMFFLERLHRTRLLPFFALVGLTGACLLVPLSNKLPYTFQRSLSFLPLNIDPAARADAQGSTEWRLKMWRDLWPQVPQYLVLGKGYALTAQDFEMMGSGQFAGGEESQMDASEGSLAVSGDYHNGPLSTLIPFGIWGGITFLWFMLAGLRAVYRNYKYGDPDLRIANIFLLAQYATHMIVFFTVFGSYSDDIFGFAKGIGFSIALNGGILGPKLQPKMTATPQKTQPRPLPQFQPRPA